MMVKVVVVVIRYGGELSDGRWSSFFFFFSFFFFLVTGLYH
jgi:hypothetical protein